MHSFGFITSLKICLTTLFVSSSHALMSAALIPLLSADLPFFESVDCSLQLFSRDFLNFFHLFRIGALIFYVVFSLIFVVFQLSIIKLIVVVQFAAE